MSVILNQDIRTRNRIYWSSVFTQTRNLAPAAGAKASLFLFFQSCSTRSAGSPESCCHVDLISPEWSLGCTALLQALRVMTECRNLTFIHGRPSQVAAGAEEQTRECREQEYKDGFGSCKPCRQCDAGQELSQVGTPHLTSPLSPVLQVKLKESRMLAEPRLCLFWEKEVS